MSTICSPGQILHNLCLDVINSNPSNSLTDKNKSKLIITFSNYGFIDITLNFLEYMKILGIKNVLVFALDEKTFEKLQILNFFTFLLPRSEAFYPNESCNYGTLEFNNICNIKPWIVLQCIKGGFDVVWSDTDIVWIQVSFL